LPKDVFWCGIFFIKDKVSSYETLSAKKVLEQSLNLEKKLDKHLSLPHIFGFL